MMRKKYRILFLLVTLLLVAPTNMGRCITSLEDSIQPPENYYIWHFDELTFGGLLFDSNIIPKQDMPMYSFPDDGHMIATIEAGEVVHYIDNVAITHPRRNPVKVIKAYCDNGNKVNLNPGEYVYPTMYSDGGYFRAWYKNKEVCIDGTGINNIFKGSSNRMDNWGDFKGGDIECEIWLYVKKPDGTIGWVSWINRNNWGAKNK